MAKNVTTRFFNPSDEEQTVRIFLNEADEISIWIEPDDAIISLDLETARKFLRELTLVIEEMEAENGAA